MASNVVDDSTVTVLVVGATGATGRHVVQMLLDKGHSVKVVVRSKEKMIGQLKGDEASYGDSLAITEASLLDMTDEQIKEQVKDCQAVISCLGHNLSVQGIWGFPRRLVSDSVKRLTSAMPDGCRFVLMNSDGVTHPDGATDRDRPLSERTVLFMLRHMIPPHADNEEAAAYLFRSKDGFEWCAVRPTNLIDGEVADYELFDSPPGSLFGDSVVTRASVAAFMVDLVTDSDTWAKHKHRFPVVQNTDAPKPVAVSVTPGETDATEPTETIH